jgi:hypothetical protein
MDWGLAKSYRENDGAQGILTARSAILSSVRSAAGADASSASAELTQQGTVVGTPVYMPPEQADNPAGVDHRADIYALGAILYELLCGKAPYKGSSFQVLNALFKNAPEPPSRRSPSRDIPPALEAITLKAMARKKEDRYQSAAELRRDLERFLDGEAVSAYQEDFKEALRRWAGQRKGLLITLAGSLVALIIGLSYSFRIAVAERSAARKLSALAVLQGFDSRLQAWKTAQLVGIDESARATCSALEKAFAFIRASEEALPLSNLTALHKDAQALLRETEAALTQRILTVNNAVREADGPDCLREELKATRDSLASDDRIVQGLKALETALTAGENSAPPVVLEAQAPLLELQGALQAVRAQIDEAYAEGLVARFPQVLVNQRETFQRELALGRRWPLFEIRALWRLHRERDAAALVTQAISEQTGKDRDDSIAAALEAIALRLQREPRWASLESQRLAFDTAIEVARKSAAETAQILERHVHKLSDIFLKEGAWPSIVIQNSLPPAWLFMRRAEVLRDLGEFDAAARDFERAVTIAPADAYLTISQLKRMTSRVSSGETIINLIHGMTATFGDIARLSTDDSSAIAVPEAQALVQLLRQSEKGLEVIAEIEALVNRGTLNATIARLYLLELHLAELQTARVRELALEALEDDPRDINTIAIVAESLIHEPKALTDEIVRMEAGLRDWPKQIENSRSEMVRFQREQTECQASIDELKRKLELTGNDQRKSSELKGELRQKERDLADRRNDESFHRRRNKFLEVLLQKTEANLPRYRDEVKSSKESFETRALKMARDALQIAPEHDRLNYVVGEILRRQGRLQDSIAPLLLGARPSMFTERHISLANACLGLGDPKHLEIGVDAIRRAMRFDNIGARGTHEVLYSLKSSSLPADPGLHEVLAQLRWKQGKKAEALANSARAIALAESWALNSASRAEPRDLMTERVDELRLRLALWHRELGLETEARMLLDHASKGKGPAAKKAGELLGR